MSLFDFTVGDEALYLLARPSRVLELDPLSNDIVDRDSTGTETQPVYISYFDGHLWLCECPVGRSAEFDPNSDTVISTIEGDPLGPGIVDPQTGIGWITQRLERTITPFNLETRELEASIGLKGVPPGFTFGFGAIWLAAEEYVYRIDSSTRRRTEIEMPEGVTAIGVGLDEETRTIWISTCAVD